MASLRVPKENVNFIVTTRPRNVFHFVTRPPVVAEIEARLVQIGVFYLELWNTEIIPNRQIILADHNISPDNGTFWKVIFFFDPSCKYLTSLHTKFPRTSSGWLALTAFNGAGLKTSQFIQSPVLRLPGNPKSLGQSSSSLARPGNFQVLDFIQNNNGQIII